MMDCWVRRHMRLRPMLLMRHCHLCPRLHRLRVRPRLLQDMRIIWGRRRRWQFVRYVVLLFNYYFIDLVQSLTFIHHHPFLCISEQEVGTWYGIPLGLLLWYDGHRLLVGWTFSHSIT